MKRSLTVLCALLCVLCAMCMFATPTQAGGSGPPAVKLAPPSTPMLLTTTTDTAGTQAVLAGQVRHVGVWRGLVTDEDGDLYYTAYVSIDLESELGGITNVGFNLGSGRADLWALAPRPREQKIE